jgi:dipeptidyl-peptidase-3
MAKISHSIKQAERNAANENQKQMLESYARTFGTGSIEAFKESQRIWVKDQKPVLETNLGFVETYRDPHGVRGEWEGLIALVRMTTIFALTYLTDTPRLTWNELGHSVRW